jgi:predicted nuclease with TOPRIM domain
MSGIQVDTGFEREREDLLAKIAELAADKKALEDKVGDLEDAVTEAEEDAASSEQRASSCQETLAGVNKQLAELRAVPLDEVVDQIETIQETIRAAL